MPFRTWSWDQIVLILGPLVSSTVLLGLFATGLLPVTLIELLLVIAILNVGGDFLYAVRNERGVKRGHIPICNDVVGSRAVAERGFSESYGAYRGTVWLGGERWRAVCDHSVHRAMPVEVVGRRGLVLHVAGQEGAARKGS